MIQDTKNFFEMMRTRRYFAFLLLGLIAIAGGIYWYVDPPERDSVDFLTRRRGDSEIAPSYELPLGASSPSLPMPMMSNQFEVLGINSRPDRETLEVLVAVGGDERILEEGEVAYLSMGEKVGFAEGETNLWVKALEIGDRVSLEVNVHLNQGHFQEVFHYEAFGKKNTAIAGQELLEEAKWFPPDLLFAKYGGEVYRMLQNKYRLKVGGTTLFVSEGELIMWNGKEWVNGADKNSPLAQVKHVSPHQTEIKLWDASGFTAKTMNLSTERGQPLSLRMESEMSRIRKRTKKRISCQMGKKGTLLTTGDWLVKSKKGWKVIKSVKEIQDCLDYRNLGELFIFDRIEKGKIVGTLFDSLRIYSQPVTLPITQEVKK